MAKNAMTCILCFLRFLLFQDYKGTVFKETLKFDLLVDGMSRLTLSGANKP